MKTDNRVTIEVELTGRTLKVLLVMSEIAQSGRGIASRARVTYDTTLGILVALLDTGLVRKERLNGYAWVITDKGQGVLDVFDHIKE